MKKLVAVIGAGKFQVSGIKKLKELGYNVIAFDGNENAEGKELCDFFYCIDIKKHNLIIEILKNYEKELLASLCFSTEPAIRTVAAINEHFNLKGINFKSIQNFITKEKQRLLQNKYKIPHPNFLVISEDDLNRINNITGRLNYPLVIKPIDNAGSRGVFIVKNIEELANRVKSAFNYCIYEKKLIIEEFIPGKEFTVESLVVNGKCYTLAISEKKKPVNNFTVSTELFYYSPLVLKNKKKIEDLVNRFLIKSNINNSIIHTEIIYSFEDNNFYIIESSPRSGGFFIGDKILSWVTGYDAIEMNIKTQLYNDIGDFKNLERPCILRFFSTNTGLLKKINIVDSNYFSKISGIEYGFFINEGEYIEELTSDGKRPGYIISYGENWEEVFHKANLVEYLINFEIIPNL